MAVASRVQDLPSLERAVRASRDTDNKLINWWLYELVLSWITVGIYGIYLFFKRINRRDEHFARIKDVFSSAIRCTRQVADDRGIDVHTELAEIEQKLQRAEGSILTSKGGVLWLLLTIITLGIAYFWVLFFLTRDWIQLQRFEQELMDDFSKVWMKVGIVKYPVSVDVIAPDRNYWLYLLLSILTLGIWWLYWDYTIHTDPDKVFKESARWEETLLASFRQA